MCLNWLRRIISRQKRVKLVSYLLSVTERVIEVLKDLIRLKVFLLIIYYCLEACGLTNSPELIRQHREALIEHAEGLLDILCLVTKSIEF